MFFYDYGWISLLSSRAAAYRELRSGRLGGNKYERKGQLAPWPSYIPLPQLRVTKSRPCHLSSLSTSFSWQASPTINKVHHLPHYASVQKLLMAPCHLPKKVHTNPFLLLSGMQGQFYFMSPTSRSGLTSHNSSHIIKGHFLRKAFVNL